MRPILPFILILLYAVRPAQAQPARVLTVASYNVCNLFDTINDPGIRDLVLTPEAYEAKTVALARVIGGLSADIVALCEVENAGVLGDLLASAPLDTVPYRFIHYDSPDNRGIDVALLYRRDRVEPLASEPIRVSDGYPTRDILRAEFAVTGTDRRIAVYAVHLPSRRGGYGRAARMRETIAARLGDMAAQEAPGTGAIVLGDLNDHPGSKLVRRNLSGLRCLTAAPHRRGQGSYAWRDTWVMYDHIFVSRDLEPAEDARIFLRDWMLTAEGRFRGYPDRTISDHLPVYVRLFFR
ncbi:endonuclease/exonuclease/phosphatase family protein [Rikenella microfusus]|uniref:endonuclease/exonuclease/phosphatase family protein n=1 Tax=Rikenella microfusus TaxID=28139 RepID=UPI001DFA9D51|nr:endonuclease/exonuclease/phosphatase family protein [Rikenella microfusus]HJE87799.1 endonuclease/exonuclease/phosphatase family protein [Rikenella microfusus]